MSIRIVLSFISTLIFFIITILFNFIEWLLFFRKKIQKEKIKKRKYLISIIIIYILGSVIFFLVSYFMFFNNFK